MSDAAGADEEAKELTPYEKRRKEEDAMRGQPCTDWRCPPRPPGQPTPTPKPETTPEPDSVRDVPCKQGVWRGGGGPPWLVDRFRWILQKMRGSG